MNPVGQPLQQRALSKRLIVSGIIGLILFIMFQVAPSVVNSPTGDNTTVISKAEARSKAILFAEQKLKYTEAPNDHWSVLYQTDSSFYGYMSREKLLEDYTNKKLDQHYPFDVYRVTLNPSANQEPSISVDLNMYTGTVVAFTQGEEASSSVKLPDNASITANEEQGSNLSLAQKEELARPWLQEWSVNPTKLKIESNDGNYGLVYTDHSVQIGETLLHYYFNFTGEQVSSFKAGFTAPSWHTTYVKDQTSLANKLTLFGYGLPTLALGVLALIFSILRREHTTFKRGVFLSSVYFVISMISTYNMLPESTETGLAASITSLIMFIIYALYSLLMSSLLYFSLVGGDGLWRKEQGLNLWPRAKEPGYGKYVLDSMRAGYIWAFVLLGVQTLMFIVLSLTLHNWSTTDATQSPYNMRYAWLLPIVAWLAGLSEEAVYRFFGIPMLKKVFRSTLVACLITTLVWAFGHTLYPIYPVTSRPIELTVIGLLFSYIFLRYGFIAVMFSHVVFDSILMGATLIFMKESVNVGSGIFAIVMPFLVGYIVYRFNRPQEPKGDMVDLKQ